MANKSAAAIQNPDGTYRVDVTSAADMGTGENITVTGLPKRFRIRYLALRQLAGTSTATEGVISTDIEDVWEFVTEAGRTSHKVEGPIHGQSDNGSLVATISVGGGTDNQLRLTGLIEAA